MKKIYFLYSVLMFFLFQPAIAFADEAYDIMLKNYNVYEGDDSQAILNMELINKNGKKRIREILFWTLERGDEDKSMMYFLKPPADKGVSFLTWEHKKQDDDQWLYLPALKRVKRISAADKSKSFMGTDFSYNDLAWPHPDEFVYKSAGSEQVDENDCFIIEGVHKTYTDDAEYKDKTKYQYSRQIIWIRKDNNIMVRAVLYDEKGREFKNFSAKEIKKLEGIWTAMLLEMKNIQSGHRTVISIRDIKYNNGLSDDFFTTRELEKTR